MNNKILKEEGKALIHKEYTRQPNTLKTTTIEKKNKSSLPDCTLSLTRHSNTQTKGGKKSIKRYKEDASTDLPSQTFNLFKLASLEVRRKQLIK